MGAFAFVFAQSKPPVRLLNPRGKESRSYRLLTEMLDLPKMSVHYSPTPRQYFIQKNLAYHRNLVGIMSAFEADRLWREKEVFLYG